MARTTTNLGLKVWDLPADQFNPNDLVFNWDTLDAARYSANLGSPPGSPVNGQLFYLGVSNASVSATWAFHYNSASGSSYKWEYVGGGPLWSSVATAETTTSTTYTALTTAGPSITVPRAGDYEITFGYEARMTAGAPGYVSAAVKLGGAAIADAERASTSFSATSLYGRSTRVMVRTLAASDVLLMQYLTSTGTAEFGHRYIQVRPIRIS